ncbi:MAG: plasmid pRiA4b ORF-3 family protein [Bacteroidales bacterium]|jgi:hypothetical protein|nr:plasmid pRiA4b ORF-3 family protein [Bacteroidales bacterium]
MYYYKFKVSFDEVDDFERSIEILSSDNFESLHQILYDSIGLKGHELAAFSVCDAKWNKRQEITLIDMQDDQESETPDYDEEEEFSTSSNIPKFTMKESVLKDFIYDPHQHIMYEYDFIHPKVFYLELVKTLPAKEKEIYPNCTLSVGELPKENEQIVAPNSEDEFMDEFFDKVDEDDLDDGFMEDSSWNESQSDFDSY